MALLTIVEMATALPILLRYCMPCASDSIHPPLNITKDNYPRSDKEHNPTIAIIELISSCKPTECGRPPRVAFSLP